MDGPIETTRFPRPARGFTLIEIVVVLFILGVAIAMAAAITNALTASQRLSTTTARMQAIDAALVQFVMQQKRLPCPADITLAPTNAQYGKEITPNNTTGCTTNEINGVVPWVSLALSQDDVTDGWGRLFTYRVQPTLAAVKGMDMSWCDPAGTAAVWQNPLNPGAEAIDECNPGCTSSSLTSCTPPATFLAGAGGRGLVVRNASGVVVMSPPTTGAAYVVISHGETGGHGYTASGQIFPGTTVDGNQEQQNYADLGYTAGVSYYADDSISEGSGPSHFDDLVSRPSVLSVATKAGLGPRSHP
jgi:prepilin-type N-terminal cleavage/methylation domain-containing protein